MRYNLSHQIGQPSGKDVPHTFSRGSPDSGVQLTGSNCHTWPLPHNLGLTFWDRKDSGEEDAQSIISAKINVPNQLYTYFYAKRTNMCMPTK